MKNPAKQLNETWQQASNKNALFFFWNLFFVDTYKLLVLLRSAAISKAKEQRKAIGKERKKLAGQ